MFECQTDASCSCLRRAYFKEAVAFGASGTAGDLPRRIRSRLAELSPMSSLNLLRCSVRKDPDIGYCTLGERTNGRTDERLSVTFKSRLSTVLERVKSLTGVLSSVSATVKTEISK